MPEDFKYKRIYGKLTDLTKKAKEAVFASEDPRPFSALDMEEELKKREKKMKRQIEGDNYDGRD
jgi:hypothetical protein